MIQTQTYLNVTDNSGARKLICIRVLRAKGNPKGTHVFGPVARELQKSDFSKIVSLASEAL
ncbi:unnamed protein product [Sphagnum jensenii]|uniref:Uncharacterized protein n=2 Tax=Sphagnum jensenii TaxID=128206 RepID=A0ABP0VUC4_9BRYO